ncbi:MAG: hypothetical protein GIKADHBN_00223 [Phycisphaerales bacterium]|nr:hypothetical protein [Phycisphaerales bacterium]
MQIVRTFRSWQSAAAIADTLRAYGPRWEGDGTVAPEAYQLEQFNRLWAGYVQRIPYFRSLRDSGRAPDRFESLDQFADSISPLDKPDVRARGAELTDPLHPPESMRITGGSTGEPTRMAAWRREHAQTLIDKWVGRSFYGVGPGDSLFTIWGHSHLLGKGLSGRVKAASRRFRDWLLSTHRFSAYNLSPESLRKAGQIVLDMRPGYIIAYSSALEDFARVNEDRAADFARAGIKMALATGEVFPTTDGPDVVRRVLGCPLALEYGSVETDILAHTHPGLAAPGAPPGSGYRVFWRNYYLECEAPGSSGERALLVTSLYPRAFPLVRYRIGDCVTLFDGDRPRALTRVASVAGRTNAFIQLADGTRVHTMGIKHCVEGLPDIARFQVIQPGGADAGTARGITELRVHLNGAGAPGQAGDAALIARRNAERAIREKAAKIHAELGVMPIVFDRPLHQTRAGKTPIIAVTETVG